MPPLLEQNYVRNTTLKRPPAAASGSRQTEGEAGLPISGGGSGGGLLSRLTCGLFGGGAAQQA